ncbi:FtsX-like permease family protein [Bacillus lacus]|uniref:FtsX-like permease family protein n=1 Tax=Metabacillus lacus TaxID=1983721 RepID=A0A7X2IXT3_9BACI|nr:ABC transporter permease [Metabacillus lacus]MRX71620.1 FtsX-like permease family protein [Metabacillus lacus]
MKLLENIQMAFASVLAHKMRSMLTMLGIIIGVGAVIVVVAIGQGGEQMLKSQIVGPGNTIEVYYEPSEEEMRSDPNAFTAARFTQADINMLQDIPEVKQVVASVMEPLTMRVEAETFDTTALGINQAYLEVNSLDLGEGRGFTDSDFLGGRRVAVISQKLKEEAFKESAAVGSVIWLGGQPAEVVGVLRKPTGLLSFSSNEVYLPFPTYRNAYGKSNYTQVTLQANSADDIQEAGESATDMLNDVHGTEESYKVINFEELADGIGQITSIMTLIISSIAGISLLVGGIGVMNIMLVSVTERTREIGIRKALGATRNQILTQFLIEAVTLTFIGGVLGVLLGVGVSSIVSAAAGWPSLISWQVVTGALLFSMLIGIVFGMLPANKAAKLNPIEALRYE